MTGKIYELVKQCIDGKQRDDFLLTRTQNRPVKNFRGTWATLCRRIGRSNLLKHDLRRSAARALRNAGVAESVIMETGGWSTKKESPIEPSVRPKRLTLAIISAIIWPRTMNHSQLLSEEWCSEMIEQPEVEWCPGRDLNPHAPLRARDFKSPAYAIPPPGPCLCKANPTSELLQYRGLRH